MVTAHSDPRNSEDASSPAARQTGSPVSAFGTRRPVTLVIRAFVNDDGELYGMVDEPGAQTRWQATFSHLVELVELVCARLPGEDLPAIAEARTRQQEEVPTPAGGGHGGPNGVVCGEETIDEETSDEDAFGPRGAAGHSPGTARGTC